MASTAQININVNSDTATKSVENLNNEVVAAAGSSASLRAELKKIVVELQNLEPSTARFKELSLRAGELKDQIADTNAVVGQLAGNITERLTRGITGVVQIGVAGFQVLQGAMALFGNESEDLQKTMVQLQGILNLSQALETFSGLDQKIVEIRAAFQSLTTATEAQVMATEAEAAAQTSANIATETGVVATGSLTTATTALGIAMKALPIIGLIASLGALAYAGFQYATSSSKAAKEEEKRKKRLEELNKAAKEQNATIAKESAAFVGLIAQLKATTFYSNERKEIIKDINSQYGTTLKNIQDEGKFQQQLNFEVASYIAYQRAKFSLDKNQELVERNLAKQEESRIKLSKARKEAEALVASGARKSVEDALSYRQDLREIIDRETKSLDDANKRLEGYGKITLNVNKIISEIEGTTGKFTEQTKNNTNAVDKQSEALKTLEQITNAILGLQNEVVVVENEVFKLRQENGDKSIDLAKREKEQRIDAFTKTYAEIKASIEKEITDQKVKTEQIRLLDQSLENFKQLLGEKEVEENIAKNTKIIEAEKKKTELLLLEQKTLQTEIQFGDNNTSDNKIGLLNRQLDAQIKVYDTLLDTQKISEDISLEQYEEILNERQQVYREYLSGIREQQIAEAEAEYQRQLKLNEDRLNEDQKYLITLDENGKYRVELTKEYEQEIATLSKKDQDDVLANAILTEENLNQTKLNLAEELAVSKTEIETEYLNNYKTDAEQTEEEIFQNRITQLDNYLAYAEQAFNQASQLISEYSQQQMDVAQTQLDDATKLQKDQLDQQLEQQLISREEYDNKILQLDQQQQQKELQLKRKNFRTEKSLNLVGATIDGARAVLSAFAGTTGGIIVKSIAAALAGVFAATQIALIAKQEFKAAKGGIVPGDGSGDMDTIPSRLAPGEAVINSSSTEQFLPLLSAINEVGGGKSFMPDLPATNGSQKFQPVFAEDRPQQMVKAYVVESELSQVQKRINRIERSTSF